MTWGKLWCPSCGSENLRRDSAQEMVPVYEFGRQEPLCHVPTGIYCSTCGENLTGYTWTFPVPPREQAREKRRKRVAADVLAEMVKQDQEFGVDRKLTALLWQCVLGEEFGEVCRAILERDPGPHLREELCQLAAVAQQFIDAIDDGRYTVRGIE